MWCATGVEPVEPVGRDRLDAHLQREVRDDRREVAVAGALAVPVDRALHLHRATAHAGERVRDTRAAVVVQMDRDADVAPEVGDDLAHDPFDVVRERAAVRVAQHQPARARLRRAFEHAQRELGVARVAVEEVLGVEQHVEPGPRGGTRPSRATIATPSSSVVPSASMTW